MRGSASVLLCLVLVGCSSSDAQPVSPPSQQGGADAAARDVANESSDATPEVLVLDAWQSTPDGCVVTEPSPELTCNRKDDDCNGKVDDVDLGRDGFCDCLGIMILGSPGANTSSAFVEWLEKRGTTAMRRLDATGPLAESELAGYDIVILDQLSRTLDAPEVQSLQKFVRSGGGLVSMTGYNWSGQDAVRPNAIIEGLGARYLVDIRPNQPVTNWDATHPIGVGIDSVTFAGGYGVEPLAGFKTSVVATIDSVPVGVAVDIDEGRMFVWGDEWIEYDSEWKTLPTIERLWANVINWLGSDRCVGVQIY